MKISFKVGRIRNVKFLRLCNRCGGHGFRYNPRLEEKFVKCRNCSGLGTRFIASKNK